MANPNATQLKINLSDSLNLNTNKAEIVDFAGFNRRNSPFFNGGLSPLFKQEKTGSVIDKEGNVYKCENGNFYKNDTLLTDLVEQFEYVREEIDLPNAEAWCVDKYGQICYAKGDVVHYGSFSYEISTSSTYSPEYDIFQISYVRQLDTFIVISHGEVVVIPAVENPTADNVNYKAIGFFSNAYSRFYKIGYCETSVSIDGMTYNNVPQVRIQAAQNDVSRGEIEVPAFTKILVLIADAPNNTTELKYKGEYTDSTKKLYISPDSERLLNAGVTTTDNPFYGCYKFNISIVGTTMTITASGMTDKFYSSTAIVESISEDEKRILADGTMLFWHSIATYNSKKYTVSMDFKQPRFSSTAGFMLWHGGGCDAPDGNGKYTRFSLDRKINDVCYNSNVPSGVSHNDTLLSPWLDVESNNAIVPYLLNYKNNTWGICYKSKSLQKIIIIYAVPVTENKLSVLENRYVYINTTDYLNGYDIEREQLIHLFSDFNNRVYVGDIKTPSETGKTVSVAGCQNGNYEVLQDSNISAIFNPRIKHMAVVSNPAWYDSMTSGKVCVVDTVFSWDNRYSTQYWQHINKVESFVDLFLETEDVVKVPEYLMSIKQQEIINIRQTEVIREQLAGVFYPVSTDGNIILSPSALSVLFDSQIGADYIKDGRYFNLIYYEGIPILAYYYGSGVANSEARFVIQGQSFVIRNGLIYSTSYYNGLMTIGDAVVNVDDLQFIGCLPLAAFFFSPATKCVLMFTGDRNLQTAFEATELKAVNNYKYAPNDNSLYLATQDSVYVLFNTPEGNSFIYKIDEENVTDFVPQDNGCIAMKSGNIWKIFSFFERENFEKIPLKLSTKFYGAGLNRVSTVDCWYLRLFTDKAEKGSVKVKVQTMTNRSCTSEEQTFEISKEDWDENTMSIYLRYQPKLQRSVGVSLSVESDFAVYDIQASIKPDATIQVTSERGF